MLIAKLAEDIYQVVFWFGQHRTSNRRELTDKGADDAAADKTKINQNQGQAHNNCLTKYVS